MNDSNLSRRVGVHPWLLALALVASVAGVAGCGTGGQPASAERGVSDDGSGGVNAPRFLDAPTVVLWSFDGFAARYLDEVETPNFDRVLVGGVRSDGLIPPFPSLTFPAHYTLATGLYPQRHGIVANSFYDPERDAWYSYRRAATVTDPSWYSGTPIWVTAERAGMVTGSYFFVGSEAAIGGVLPTHTKRFDPSVSGGARVDSVLAWLSQPAERRPHLITMYVSDVDGAGHASGPSSSQVAGAVRRVDALLGRMLEGLERLPQAESVTLVLTSDHGMTAVDQARTELLSDHIDVSDVIVSGAGAYANLFVREGRDSGRLRDLLDAGLQHGRAYLADDVPPRLHFSSGPRVGDVVVVMDDGWLVAATRDRVSGPGLRGTHGFDPFLPSMHALFLARGPGLPAGVTIPAFESVHLAPWILQRLGLAPPPGIDGEGEHLQSLIDAAPR